MKKLIRPAITIGLSLVLAFLSAALTWSAQALPVPNLSGATLFLQTTPTPQAVDKSEVGSTNEILIMGGVIALIIFAPIFLSRKNWRNSQH
jgi:hypothetical protein